MANNVDMGKINWTVKATAEEASEQVKKLSTNISGLSKVLKAVNFTAFIAGCRKIGQTIYALTGQTSQYIQTMNRFKIIMGDSAKEAQNFINKAESILGLDPEQMMTALSSFQTLTKGFGIASDEAYKMSQNLTQLAADMHSFTGERFDLTLQRIKSGISGEIEPMRKWGVALDQATLQETANALGINRRVAEMTRAQKTELAYYQIMKSTTYAQGNMAKTLLTPASALRVMQAEFKQLGRAIGSVFIPMMMKIIPVVRAVTQLLTEFARWLADKAGFKLADYEIDTSTVEDIANAFADVEDNVNGTTKALKKMLMPFDELNNVNFDTGSGSGLGITPMGGSLGLDLPEYDMFAGASDEINKKVEEIKEKFKKWLPLIKAVGIALLGLFVFSKLKKFADLFGGASSAISKTAGVTVSLKTGFNNFLTSLGKATQAIAILGGIALVIKSLTGLIEAFSKSGMTLGEVAGLLGIVLGELAVAFLAIFGTMKLLEPSWQSIAGAAVILGGFALVINQVSSFLETFSKTGMTVNDVIGLMATVFISIIALMGAVALIGPAMTAGLVPFIAVIAGISAVLLVMKVTLPTILDAVATFIEKIAPVLGKVLEMILLGIQRIIDALGRSLPPIINSVGNMFKQIFTGVSKVIESVGKVIVDIMNTAKRLVVDVLDSIVKFIERLGPAINKFVDNVIIATTKLINFLISGIQYITNVLIIPAINLIISAINTITDGNIPGLSPIEIPAFVPRYEKGGFPAMGQMFIANENGPELVGNIGRRTAVANQQQITEGISEATYNAFSRALNENRNEDENPYFVVNIGDDKVYSGYAKKENQYSNMYGIKM